MTNSELVTYGLRLLLTPGLSGRVRKKGSFNSDDWHGACHAYIVSGKRDSYFLDPNAHS